MLSINLPVEAALRFLVFLPVEAALRAPAFGWLFLRCLFLLPTQEKVRPHFGQSAGVLIIFVVVPAMNYKIKSIN